MTVPIYAQVGPINGVSLPQGQVAVNAAKAQIGVPYAWGGGDASGPTLGIHDGGVADAHGDYLKKGFDCSGLTQYAWAKAGVTIGGDSRSQYLGIGNKMTKPSQAGDLVFWATNPGIASTIHHVAIWNSDNTVIQAPESGKTVEQVPMYYNSEYMGAARPGNGSSVTTTSPTEVPGATSTTVGSITSISTKAWIVIGVVVIAGIFLFTQV